MSLPDVLFPCNASAVMRALSSRAVCRRQASGPGIQSDKLHGKRGCWPASCEVRAHKPQILRTPCRPRRTWYFMEVLHAPVLTVAVRVCVLSWASLWASLGPGLEVSAP